MDDYSHSTLSPDQEVGRCHSPQIVHDDSQIRIDADSALLLSEPLDIGKWFESYVYESPELDSADGIQILDGLLYLEGESQFIGQRDERKHQIFDSPSSDNASLLNSGLHQMCSIPVNKCTHTEDHQWKKSIKEEGDEHSLIVSHGSNDGKGKRSHDTEKENQSSESGFVSVKKVRRRQGSFFTAAVEHVGFFDQDGGRKVGSETSCSFSDPIIDVGKWCCPKNRKPRLDRPPLKQLRLEQWIRCRGKR